MRGGVLFLAARRGKGREMAVLVNFADLWLGESATCFSRKILHTSDRHLQQLGLAAKK